MNPTVRTVMVTLGDVELVLIVAGYIGFAIHMGLVARRSGSVMARRFAQDRAALALFFGWFGFVYADRRWDVWPWADLVEWMGFEWYAPLRLLLLVPFALLWWALWRPVGGRKVYGSP